MVRYFTYILTMLFAACQSNSHFSGIKELSIQEPTTFINVRHAEKSNNDPNDPDLSEKGLERAHLILQMLKNSSVAAIYSSPFIRSMETIRPLSMELGLDIQTYDPADTPALMDQIWSKHAGQTVVIVGHSNTVSGLVNTVIWEEKLTNLADNDYDTMYIAVGNGKAKGHFLVINYSPEF